MGNRGSINFTESESTIREAVTKFGGQPCWLGTPQWPISRNFDKPMSFIAQVQIPVERTEDSAEKLAYIFMTAGDISDHTWNPEDGESAVVIQSRDESFVQAIPVEANATGPTTERSPSFAEAPGTQPDYVEFRVDIDRQEEPDYLSEKELGAITPEQLNEYWTAVQGTKIGGAPAFVQREEYPDDSGDWILLLQIDSMALPFFVNFGDGGIAHIWN